MTQTIAETRTPITNVASNSLYFAQTGPVVSVANPNHLLNGLTEFTIECFIYLPTAVTAGNTARIVDFGIYSGNTCYLAIGGSSTTLLFDLSGNIAYNSTYAMSPSWYHVAATYDTATMRTFINGVAGSTATVSHTSPGTGSTFYIGNTGTGGARGTQAYVQEVRISSIMRYQSKFVPPFYQFIPDEYTLALFHFNEGSGTTVYDSSSNALVGTLEGSPLPIWSPGNPTITQSV